MLATLMLAATWFTSTLSGSQLERAVSGYIAHQIPVVVLRFGPDHWNNVPSELAASGYVHAAGRVMRCGAPIYRYEPSQTLMDIARLRGWRVIRFAGGETQISIPVGTYRYIAHSAAVGVLQPSDAFIDPLVQLLPNANMKTLAFLAPVGEWSISTILGPANGSTLKDNMHPHLTTLSFHRSRLGWAVDDPGAILPRIARVLLCSDPGTVIHPVRS